MSDIVVTLRDALGDRYTIGRELGRGGMATVYLARDRKHDRDVALKVLDSDIAMSLGVGRFLREIQTTARLTHPHILPLHDSGEVEGILYYSMPYVAGESLRDRLRREKQLSVDEATSTTCDVASALDYAHRHGVLHRDIKPENILLHDGHALVADFGIAGAIAVASESRFTETGMSLGTPAYMSPEQASGEPHLDGRSDVFSLACVLYEMLAGEPPFTGPTPQAVIANRFSRTPDRLRLTRPTVPENTDSAIAKALNLVPADRFATAAQFADALSVPIWAPLPSEPLSAARNPAAALPIKRTPRLWHLLLFGTAALALAGLATILATRDRVRRAVPAADKPVALAVLPFQTLTAPEDAGFLDLGIPDAIITRLASLQQVRVRPTSAILPYQSHDVDVQQAGQTLATDYILTGTIQHVGDRLRVSVQMVRVGDTIPLWGEHYDLERANLLDLQDSVAERVTTTLRIRMSDAERARIYHRYTDNGEAYERYLEGRALIAHHTKQAALDAIKALESALELDSNYALAYAGLAMASAEMSLRFTSEPAAKQWAERAMKEARRGLALDSSIAETHLALATVHRRIDFDWERTILESRRALELSPSLDLPHYTIASAFLHLGLLDEAEQEVREGLATNPTGDRVEPLRNQGIAALFSGRYTEAIDLLEEVQRLSDVTVSDSYLAQAYYYKGAPSRAEQILERLRQSASASASNRAKASLASFQAARGRGARAQALLGEIASGGYMDHHVAYSIGVTYAQLGDQVRATQWLARAVETGFPCHPWFARDPLLNPARNDREFQRLMERLRVAEQLARARFVRRQATE